jgi:hypothetical protein
MTPEEEAEIPRKALFELHAENETLRADLKSERELNIALHNICAELREEIERLKLCQIK